jgi:hypothetical protein
MPTIRNLTDQEREVPRGFGVRVHVPPGGTLDVDADEHDSYVSQKDVWGHVTKKDAAAAAAESESVETGSE